MPGARGENLARIRMAFVCLPVVLLVAMGVRGRAAAEPAAALADAARQADWAAVRTLLQQGADVDARQGDGSTALHWASYRDHPETAALLIRAGAEVNAANDLGVTALWAACENGSPAMAEILLEAGADPNMALPFGETPLMTASRTGNADVVRQLLAAGADVDAATGEGAHGAQTALMWAVAQRHPAVVEVLLAHGADVHARSTTFTETVKTISTYANYGLQCVPREECYITEVRSGGFTPLLFAARVGDLASARLLAAAGADVNETAPDGASALAIAALSGNGDVGALLLDRGADPNAAGAAMRRCTPRFCTGTRRWPRRSCRPGRTRTPACRPPRATPATAPTSSSRPGSSGRRRSGWRRAIGRPASCACWRGTAPIRWPRTIRSTGPATGLRPRAGCGSRKARRPP